MIQTGALKAHFTMQKQEILPDGHGGSVTQWADLATFWGRLDRIDRALRATLRSGATHHIVARKGKAITPAPGMRLALYGRTFFIHDVFDVYEDGRWMGLVVEERE